MWINSILVENTNAYHNESKNKNLGRTSILPVAAEFVTSNTIHLHVRVICMHFKTQLNSINFIVLFYQISHVKHKFQVYNYLFFILRARLQLKPLQIRSSIFALFKPWYHYCNNLVLLYQNIQIIFFQPNGISGMQRWIKRHPSSNSTRQYVILISISFVLNNNIYFLFSL